MPARRLPDRLRRTAHRRTDVRFTRSAENSAGCWWRCKAAATSDASICKSIIGETSGNSTWKRTRLGIAARPSAPNRGRKSVSRCFHAACSVPNTQRNRCFKRPRTVSGASVQRDRVVFVDDLVAGPQDPHGQVGIFCERVVVESAGLEHELAAPRAHRAGNDRDAVQRVERTALEILTGDVFEGLPARQQIDPVADLGVSRHCADARRSKRLHELAHVEGSKTVSASSATTIGASSGRSP